MTYSAWSSLTTNAWWPSAFGASGNSSRTLPRDPGKSRKELANQFALSERQVQADLNVIRREMGLPLVRRQGYRFLTDTPDTGPQFSLAEAQLLLMLLRRAAHDPSLPVDRLRSLMVKLPFLFPLHLRPLVAKTLEAANGVGSRRSAAGDLRRAGRSAAAQELREAALSGGRSRVSSIQEPIVQPEVLFPYCKSWHLIGTCRQRGRMMVFDLDNVVAVTAAAGA